MFYSKKTLQKKINRIMKQNFYNTEIIDSGISIGDIVFGRVVLGKKGEKA